MKIAEKLEVFHDGRPVGVMAPFEKYQTAFEYLPEWEKTGFSLNPFSLPLDTGLKISKRDPFEGVFGIFADSLPDGWGKLLVDRMLRKMGEVPDEISAFARLSIVGDSGMGALEYKPVFKQVTDATTKDLDRLSEECRKLLTSKESGDLDVLFAMGGSSGGARPKVMMDIDGESWIIKFPSAADPDSIGLMEYEYNVCAKKCGIDVPEVRLFPSGKGPGYFGSKRFDRIKNADGVKKLHMASASALLEVSHRVPALDYTSLMALTWQLTKREEEMYKMFRLMCFNVFSHNRDDHSNNFSFLCDSGIWCMAPAYDLTYSDSVGGEHATTIDGEGREPSLEDILRVAKKAGIKESEARNIAKEIQEVVNEELVGKSYFG